MGDGLEVCSEIWLKGSLLDYLWNEDMLVYGDVVVREDLVVYVDVVVCED